jgi:hypothetical protein
VDRLDRTDRKVSFSLTELCLIIIAIFVVLAFFLGWG